MKILGVHTTHDAGAALIEDGKVLAAASEERFNRVKHYGYLPIQSIDYCLKEANVGIEDVDIIAVPSLDYNIALQFLFNLSNKDMARIFPLASGMRAVRQRLKKNALDFLGNKEALPAYIKTFPKNKKQKSSQHTIIFHMQLRLITHQVLMRNAWFLQPMA